MSESAPSVAAQPVRRAVRDTSGHYPGNQRGGIAFGAGGALLDREDWDDDRNESFAWASAWQLACGCIAPEFRRLVPRRLALNCLEHGRRTPVPIPSEEDPWPMSNDEKRAAEAPRWLRLANRLNIPTRYHGVRLDDVTATPAVVAMREFLFDERNDERCIVEAGPTGVGKTTAVIAGVRERVIWGGHKGAYFSMSALARALLGEDRDEALDQCLEADLLAVDDVGGAYTKEGGLVETLFEEILVEREANKMLTMLSTNLTLPAFAQAMGDRVADRVIRGQWGHWVSLPGQSLRRKRAEGRR